MGEELKNIVDIPAYIFGGESFVASGASSQSVGAVQVVESWFATLLFIAAALYLAWINHWSARGDNHKDLFRLFAGMQRDSRNNLVELSPSLGSYITGGSLLGVVSIWVALVTVLHLTGVDDMSLALLALAGLFGFYTYQIAFAYIIGVSTDSGSFFAAVRHLKGICFSVVGIIVLPTVLCYALTHGEVSDKFAYLLGFELVVITVLYLIKTFMLFLSKKVSLLHTILYLCAVEIFPITLVWGIFCR